MAGYQDRSGGALFPERNRKSDKSPTSTGFIDLNADLVSQIVAKSRSGEPVKIRIAAWSREGNSGKFLSLSAELDGANRQQGQQYAGNNSGGRSQQGQTSRGGQRDTGRSETPFDDDIPF